MESNHLPSGYEPPALTDELQPRCDNYTMDEAISEEPRRVAYNKEKP